MGAAPTLGDAASSDVGRPMAYVLPVIVAALFAVIVAPRRSVWSRALGGRLARWFTAGDVRR